MPELTSDEMSVLDRFDRWIEKFERIRGLYDGSTGRMPAERREEARQLYTELKRGLEEEHKNLSSSRRRPALTAAEDRWYVRAIHAASVHLRARTNSHPDEWLSSLYDARSDIEMVAWELRRFGGLSLD